jgi:hypothetical protein
MDGPQRARIIALRSETNPDEEAPMTSIDEVRADVQRATRELMQIADCGVPATAATEPANRFETARSRIL